MFTKLVMRPSPRFPCEERLANHTAEKQIKDGNEGPLTGERGPLTGQTLCFRELVGEAWYAKSHQANRGPAKGN